MRTIVAVGRTEELVIILQYHGLDGNRVFSQTFISTSNPISMGAKFISNKDETVRMFENPVLEYFSHIHPITPVVVYVPVVLWCVWNGAMELSWLVTLVMLPLGVLLWTFLEYTIHRWAFHIEPRTERGRRLHFLVHGVHHDYPRDSTRLVMPLLVSVPLALVIYWSMRGLVPGYHWGLFAGLLIGYVAYDSIHYATHHFNPKGRLGRFLKEYHMKHHFVDDHTAYGVSNPLWDYVFNTVPDWVRRRKRARTTNG
ncbi:MAG TPA: sterol desaturase family protein [Chlorobiota bacterium]|nr:sterol desaturase family protein [Chlorobiota bacterium]